MSEQIQSGCRRDHNTSLRKIRKEIDAHTNRHESRDFYHKRRSITKTLSSKTWAVEDNDGRLVTELDQLTKIWKSYCQSLFQDSQSENFPNTDLI